PRLLRGFGSRVRTPHRLKSPFCTPPAVPTLSFGTPAALHLEWLIFMSPATQKKPGRKALIRCVIFDLDDTLYDCLGQRVRPSHRHAAEAMVKAGLKADVEVVFRSRIRAFQQDPMLHHIDAVVCREFE